MTDSFLNSEPCKEFSHGKENKEFVDRLTKILGAGFRFNDQVCHKSDEVIEDFTLDPLALDRHIAAIKAAKGGKETKSVSGSTGKAIPHVSSLNYVPSTSAKLSAAEYNALVTKTFPEYETLKPGDWSEKDAMFVAWDLVRRYPTSYIGKTNRPKAAPFFESMTEEQTWDFFYVYHPKMLHESPYIFVPTKQFNHFLDIINASIQTKLTIPDGQPGEKFYITFGSSCTIRPKYVGRSSSHNEYLALQGAIPPPVDEDACQGALIHGMDFLLANLNAHLDTTTTKSKSRKKKQAKAQNRAESIYDAQTYLGLRPQAGVIEGKEKLKTDELVPNALIKEVIFICIDIEVAEEHHGTILEVGMSVLDTKDIVDIPPGETGQNWFSYIKSRHLVTADYKHIVNRKYVKGCPELFNFGESEYPNVNELRDKILSTFNELSTSGVPKKEMPFRNIVLVGHDLDSDLSYMASMNVHPWSVDGLLRCLDTKDMHQAWREEGQGRSLGFVLQDLEIPSKNLHNAGNDAAYTLRAMLGVAVRARMDEQVGRKK
ncbi:qde-2-interacting protein [Colletotrichum truncatum]|uniref:Qde-2-interacting protein n=1 Tax=Colletotrichum truncatum TaxID=5467 RepID=A0ACC3YIY7_COLTU|nr:qde-2-interacting protein [Colletotrichum truncatum]KAF6797103.1 qde-2-interacting protein [Colletotrichum truncatum]